jgi:hypothetical protein
MSQPVIGENGWVYTSRQLPKVVDGGVELGLGLLEESLQLGVVGLVCLLSELEGEPQSEQTLLGSVVKIALEASAFGVAGVNQARPRLSDFAQLRAEPSVQFCIFQGEPRRSRYRAEEAAIRQDGSVVLKSGEYLPRVAPNGCDHLMLAKRTITHLHVRISQ